jgi:undecaprenyl diphosphate synthase
MSIKEKIDLNRMPKHVAIIMDGNGRWAKQKGVQRVFGHKNGVKAVRETVTAAAELGISFLTLYAFSTENWNRPQSEVDALMAILVSSLVDEKETLMKNNVKLNVIGNITSLPVKVAANLMDTVEETSQNTGLILVLALSYSGRWEIASTMKKIAEEVKNGQIEPSQISESFISSQLQTSFMPDPELLIRTSGEFRVSNFLLWQIAYTEFYFTTTLWPDFRKESLWEAIVDYQGRERRFGKTSEQLPNT